jgi:glycosyltransferase involved in cell wall biosynthesis
MDQSMSQMTPWHVGVLIPARNEEQLLARSLYSVLQAKNRIESSATVEIVVISDSSVDRTAQIASQILEGQGIVRAIHAGRVGTARRCAAQLLLERYSGPLSRCWLANTDADCMVPPEWLEAQLALAISGVEAIAGTVDVDHFDEHGPEVRARFKSSYRIHDDESHPHVHGANLGVRADRYLKAGGWETLDTAEDHDLWRRLELTGTKRHSTSKIGVTTSGRRVGRAPNGFADALAAHNETAA